MSPNSIDHEKLVLYSQQQERRIEEERAHIARDIHDELGQSLTVLSMELSQLRKKLSPTQADLLAQVNSMETLTRETIKSVNRICTKLRPTLLDNLGLSAALEWQAQE